MGKRFNPPPNWPPPPEGWEPPRGWVPDPSWGPPPDGWELWVDERKERYAARQAEIKAKGDARLARIKAKGDERLADMNAKAAATDAAVRPDIAAARAAMRVSWGGGRELKRLEQHLWDGETVERMTVGNYGPGRGLVVLTDCRLLFLKDGWTHKATEDFPLSKISSVQWRSGLLGTLTIFASGNQAAITNVDKNDGREIADIIRQRLAAPVAPTSSAPAAAAAAEPDPFDQMAKLGQLRDAGVLTPEEFEAKKAEILSRM